MFTRIMKLLSKLWSNPMVQFTCVAILEHVCACIKKKNKTLTTSDTATQQEETIPGEDTLLSSPKKVRPRKRVITNLDGSDRKHRKKINFGRLVKKI